MRVEKWKLGIDHCRSHAVRIWRAPLASPWARLPKRGITTIVQAIDLMHQDTAFKYVLTGVTHFEARVQMVDEQVRVLTIGLLSKFGQ